MLLLALMSWSSCAWAATLTDVVDHLGKYPYELKLLDRPAFKQRLTRLLGPTNYTLLDKTLETQGPLSGTRNLVYFSGIQAHRGGETGAVVVYDTARDAVKVWLKANGRLLTFEEVPFVNPSLFPNDLRVTIQNLYQF
jgi:hypothetical protein